MRGKSVLLWSSIIVLILVALGVISGAINREAIAYLGLFVITTLGGSIIPAGSPFLVLSGAISGMDKVPLVLVAATGYTAGFLINYYLAKFLGMRYVEERISADRFELISGWLNRWGLMVLVAFAFVFIFPAPILALVCGLFNVRLYYFIPINFAGNLFNSYIFVFLGGNIRDLIGLI
ncbi:MAG: VTT domain-containing protein [Halobacteriota archaeon]|nr:VTT domain-containing protein [Halobacteriota archaeon]